MEDLFMYPFEYCNNGGMNMPVQYPQVGLEQCQFYQSYYNQPIYQYPGFHNTPGYSDMHGTNLMSQIPYTALTRDPPPILTNNPAVASISLFKELTGYPNYGNPSGNADILYTGNRGAWTFEIPAFLFVPGNLRGQIIIRAVLDDHVNVPINRYSANIAINGTVVHTGQVPLVHGTPSGQRFVNWRSLTFNVPQLRRNNRVVIANTSTAGPDDWIGLDWMELRLIPR